METKTCVTEKKLRKKHLHLVVDSNVFNRFKDKMKKEEEDNISELVEMFMECYTRDECEGCPYLDEEDREQGFVKVDPNSVLKRVRGDIKD